ncbi:MAG: bifunctional precorrin-2 dehydrogenase/sirohydrochlorin ferrochelatase [Dehalococcoidia bacterium]
MGLMLDIQPGFGRALVIGGGEIAARKIRTLAEAEFEMTVVAPTVVESIRLAPHVRVIEREWREDDLEGHSLVLACTNSREVNRAIGEAARRRGLPVLVADRQGESTFFTPAILREGDVQVAVSTGGASPRLAKEIRTRIAEALGRGWGRVAYFARMERTARLGEEPREEMTRDVYEAMVRRTLGAPEHGEAPLSGEAPEGDP